MSLIELILTISIVCVLGVIAVPRFNTMRARHAEENLQRTINRAIGYASTEARRRSIPITIMFNQANEIVRIEGVQNGMAVPIPWAGAIAGAQLSGGDQRAWVIRVDAHGQVIENERPVSATTSGTGPTAKSGGNGR